MTVALRAHHLLCMLTYAGNGYSPEFVHNFDGLASRLAAGEEVFLVEGPDAVCAPLCESEGACAHCHGADVRVRDQRAAQELAPLLGGSLGGGSHLRLDAALLTRLRTAYASGDIRGACAGCDWADLCARIASAGYEGVRLRMQTAAAAHGPR
ncbi:MAG: DUF1284 domain-containing protein [Giesbergeria sp.]